MSYHDFEPTTREGKIGKAIYLEALDDRRGFRYDQIGIEDEEIWNEIFEHMGREALKAVAAMTTKERMEDDWQEMDSAPRDGSEFFAWCMERPAWSTAPRHFADIARWSGKTPHDHIGHFSARSGAIVTRWKPINPPI